MFTSKFRKKDNGNLFGVEASKSMTLCDCWEKLVTEDSEAKAIQGKDFQWTRKELDQRADRIAHFLCNIKDLSASDGVALFCIQNEDYVAALLGVLKAGCVVVPVDHGLRWDNANQYISDGECKYILTDSHGLEICENMGKKNVVDVGNIFNDTFRSFSRDPKHASSDSTAFIMHTSGTTGFPKAVRVTHPGLYNMVMEQIRIFGLLPSDRVLLYSSINFDSSLAEMFTGLFSGACLVVAVPWDISDTFRLRSFLQRNKVTVITVSPGLLEKFNHTDFPTLRVLILAGEQLQWNIAKRFAGYIDCFNAYGLTETSVCVTCHKIDPQRNYEDVVYIGKPIDRIDLYIMNNDMQPLPIGETGEICVSGIGISPGYLNNPGLTKEKFVENPLFKGGILFRTGDRGRLLEDGDYEFMGRLEYQGVSMEQENCKEKDPRIDEIMEHLVNEGYRPRIDDDDDIAFKKEGTEYYIMMANNKDMEYYRILKPSFWSIDTTQEYEKALNAGNKATKAIKGAKIYVHDKHVEAVIETFAATPANFNSVFDRMMSALVAVAKEFIEEMRAGAGDE